VDEAGRGPWAGPVVAAAVVLHRERLSVRIDDSKRLSPRQRARAFDVILRHADVGIGIACAEEVDRRNILQATLLAMRAAVLDLPDPPDLTLVDGHQAPPLPGPCWLIIQGDRLSYAIACASIIAKEFRDRLMMFYHGLEPRYAFHLHKGYGTALHAARLRAHGPSLFHRRTFRPVLDALTQGEPASPTAEPMHAEAV
jgi:ribonuclease HII